MLKRIEIHNYRCLRQLDVELRPLTVLIGPNDTGKTTFLKAIEHLVGSTASNGVSSASDHWDYVQNNIINIKPYFEAPLEAEGDDKLNEFYFGTLGLRQQYRNAFKRFQLPAQGIDLTSEGMNDALGAPLPGRDGSGIPTLLDYYLRRDRGRFFSVVEEMKSLVPGLQDLDIRTPEKSVRSLDFITDTGLSIDGDEASAGVRLLLFFVSLANHPSLPSVILLEEPENGLHPRRLAEVVNLMRRITRGEVGGNSTQIILTTHSPYLLDCVDLDTDQVLVFRREADGSRTAESADRERLKTFLDEFQLGEVWFNRGEEGLVSRR